MVGHTHEDIDQVFSRVATGLTHQDVHTLPQLLQAISKSTSPEPICKHLNALYNYKEKLCSVTPDRLFSGIMGPHVYKFEMVERDILMSYKDWPKDCEEYRTLNITRYLGEIDNVMQVNINPKIDDAISRMTRDLPKWADSGRLQEEDLAWWTLYLSTIKPDSRLIKIAKISNLGNYKQVPVNRFCEPELGNLIEASQKNLQKESRHSQVKILRRK